jgi:hypothetical protein
MKTNLHYLLKIMKIPFIPVIRDYFEISGVVLEPIVIALLWKTVKDFAELAKVSKLQTEVRFRPWVGPNGGFELSREDVQKRVFYNYEEFR